VPGANTTFADAINDFGQIVGWFGDARGAIIGQGDISILGKKGHFYLGLTAMLLASARGPRYNHVTLP
jgi:hypothetical protein